VTELPARVRADGRGEWTLCAVRDCGCRLAQICSRGEDDDWATLQLDGWSHLPPGVWQRRRPTKLRRGRGGGEAQTAAHALGARAGGHMLTLPVKLRCSACGRVNVLAAAALQALTH